MARYKPRSRTTRRYQGAVALAAQYDMKRHTLWLPRTLSEELRAKARQLGTNQRAVTTAAVLHGLRTLCVSQIVAFAARYPDLCRLQIAEYTAQGLPRPPWLKRKGAANALRQSPSTDEQAAASQSAA